MNDNQKIPSSVRDYAQVKGLIIDHSFLLMASRYNTNFTLGIIGLLSLIPLVFAKDLETFVFISLLAIPIFLTMILSWSFLVWLRLLYAKSDWFPVKNTRSDLEIDYTEIRSFQGKNLKTILFSWMVATTCIIIFSLYPNELFLSDYKEILPFIIYMIGMFWIILRSFTRYSKIKTIMHIPLGK